ncbi:MAG: NAD(P)H-dependent oxidoreductase subunit E [Pelagibacteraceae bacterium]|nr:NAD(P)H-dependent oxidoreductase subunit E [Pelagibacteraceae bacterium]MBO6492639.1 NAD(P)H-dependent oxidoreductase subunit E [Pelagibacteraceae bacterium]
MSRNISKLSGRKGLKDNLFKRMIDTTKGSGSEKKIKQLAEEYHVGISTIHGAESFYEFLRPEHKEKKAWVCNGSACLCAGNQNKLKDILEDKLGKDKVGEMFCLGHCYDNAAFHYNGHNYSGKDIDQIDEIIKGKKIDTKNINSTNFASKSFLMGKDFSTIKEFKDLLSQVLNNDKKEILKTIIESNLCGRGGAGFPTGMKWNFCSQQKTEKKYVVCNADEGDSGAFSDRYLLEEQSLKVLFGILVCAYIIGSDEGVLYIRGEYPESIEIINGTINELKKLNLLGKNILDTNFSCDITICIGQGAYICGEETALIASIEGRRADVDVRPPFPTVEGLYKKPTVVNNVETLAAIACILKFGAKTFSSVGNVKSAGTKLICLDSLFKKPGVYEIDMGTPMKKIINEIGDGFVQPVKALQIGGPLGGVIPIKEVEKLNLDFEQFTKAGFMLGHGGIVSIPENFSMVKYIHHLFKFTSDESCGKCFPGRLGSYRGREMFDQALNKTSKIPMKLLDELLVTMKKGCLCALCGAIPVPISNILKYFIHEFKDDIE